MPICNGCTNWGTTIKFMKNDKEIWVYVQLSDGGYDMVIAEKEAMNQDIQANEMFNKINAGEALTLYINFEQVNLLSKLNHNPLLTNCIRC